jgi:hypothetical protein
MSAPWQPAACARPLRRWAPEQMQVICGVLDSCLSEWAAAWALRLPQPAASSCAPATPFNAKAGVEMHGRREHAAAWVLPAERLPARIAEALFGRAAESPLALELVRACAQDAPRRVLATFGMDVVEAPETPPPECTLPWSGCVVALPPFGPPVLLNVAAVQAVLRERELERTDTWAPGLPSSPLVSVAGALSEAPFPLQVHLEGCELEFGVLQDLQVGDLLRVTHRLEAAATVRTPDGCTLFRGYLARRHGRKAVELAPLY